MPSKVRPHTEAVLMRFNAFKKLIPMHLLLTISLLPVVCVAPAAASPIFAVSSLGTMGGWTSGAAGINSSGQATGWAMNRAWRVGAFFHDGSVMTSPGALPGTGASFGGGINDTGQIAGTSFAGWRTRATVWSGGRATDIGTLGGNQASASDINNAGAVVGGSVTSHGRMHAYRYHDGDWDDIGEQFGHGWSSAFGINNSGQVTGYGQTSSGTFRGFLWDENEGLTMLGTLGGNSSYGLDINSNGWVTGHSRTADDRLHAFLSDGDSMTDLGTLGGNTSYAHGINDAADVVGYSWRAGDRRSSAFLYSNGTMLDLNDLIPATSGWRLLRAYDINNAGQIVGTGLYGGRQLAFRLDPIPTVSNPEPGTTSLFLLGGIFLTLVGLRRRKSQPGLQRRSSDTGVRRKQTEQSRFSSRILFTGRCCCFRQLSSSRLTK